MSGSSRRLRGRGAVVGVRRRSRRPGHRHRWLGPGELARCPSARPSGLEHHWWRRCRERSVLGSHTSGRRGCMHDACRRRHWFGADEPGRPPKEAHDQRRRPCRRWCDKPSPAIACERLPDVLVRAPACPPWQRRVEPHGRERLRRREVGDRGVELDGPKVPGQRAVRGNAELGERPVPLRPSGCRLVGKVEALNAVAPLPSPVGGQGRTGNRVGACRDVSPPSPAKAPPAGGGQGAQEATGDSRAAMTRLTRR